MESGQVLKRSEIELIQGTFSLAALGTGVINITLANDPVIVEKIRLEATSLNGTCAIERNDSGSNLVTRGPVKLGLLGAVVINTFQFLYAGVEAFAVDPNTVLTFALTDLSAAPNVVNVCVQCRKIYRAK